MSSDGQSSGLRTIAITALVIPALILAFLFGIVLISDTTSQAACGPTGTALTVDPASVPEGPIAGYDHGFGWLVVLGLLTVLPVRLPEDDGALPGRAMAFYPLVGAIADRSLSWTFLLLGACTVLFALLGRRIPLRKA